MSRPTPTPEQAAILEFFRNDSRDLFIDAVAGSGKTTMLTMLADEVKETLRKMTIFLAFNRHIAIELQDRLPEGIDAKTVHSVGYRYLVRYLQSSPTWPWESSDREKDGFVDEYKYRKLVKIWFESHELYSGEPPAEISDEMRDTADLVDKLMVNLSDPTDMEQLAWLSNTYGLLLPDMARTFLCLQDILHWGRYGLPQTGKFRMEECITPTEMLYYPVTIPQIPFYKYKFVFVDEAQDINPLQREFIFRLRIPATDRFPAGRLFFVGDKFQAIYRFAGADAQSIENIKKLTGAVELPLSCCWRCPSSHLDMARKIVPHIQARPGAPVGIVGRMKRSGVTGYLKPGDLVISRMNSPLVGVAFKLIRAGIPAEVKGRNIAKGLIEAVDSIARQKDYVFEEFDKFLSLYWSNKRASMKTKNATERQLAELEDKMLSIRVIFQELDDQGRLEGTQSLVDAITRLFERGDENAPRKTTLVTLSTVHKAKGLENEDVYLLEPHKLPHPNATHPDEVQQEWNLWYVARTRAKRGFYYIENDELFGQTPFDLPNALIDEESVDLFTDAEDEGEEAIPCPHCYDPFCPGASGGQCPWISVGYTPHDPIWGRVIPLSERHATGQAGQARLLALDNPSIPGRRPSGSW